METAQVGTVRLARTGGRDRRGPYLSGPGSRLRPWCPGRTDRRTDIPRLPP